MYLKRYHHLLDSHMELIFQFNFDMLKQMSKNLNTQRIENLWVPLYAKIDIIDDILSEF